VPTRDGVCGYSVNTVPPAPVGAAEAGTGACPPSNGERFRAGAIRRPRRRPGNRRRRRSHRRPGHGKRLPGRFDGCCSRASPWLRATTTTDADCTAGSRTPAPASSSKNATHG